MCHCTVRVSRVMFQSSFCRVGNFLNGPVRLLPPPPNTARRARGLVTAVSISLCLSLSNSLSKDSRKISTNYTIHDKRDKAKGGNVVVPRNANDRLFVRRTHQDRALFLSLSCPHRLTLLLGGHRDLLFLLE